MESVSPLRDRFRPNVWPRRKPRTGRLDCFRAVSPPLPRPAMESAPCGFDGHVGSCPARSPLTDQPPGISGWNGRPDRRAFLPRAAFRQPPPPEMFGYGPVLPFDRTAPSGPPQSPPWPRGKGCPPKTMRGPVSPFKRATWVNGPEPRQSSGASARRGDGRWGLSLRENREGRGSRPCPRPRRPPKAEAPKFRSLTLRKPPRPESRFGFIEIPKNRGSDRKRRFRQPPPR